MDLFLVLKRLLKTYIVSIASIFVWTIIYTIFQLVLASIPITSSVFYILVYGSLTLVTIATFLAAQKYHFYTLPNIRYRPGLVLLLLDFVLVSVMLFGAIRSIIG